VRELNEIIVHCSDTRTNQSFSIDTVKQWHLSRGFSDVGYHYYIRLDGMLEEGRPIEKAGAHCKGHNSNSIGVCFEGGKKENGQPWDKPTDEQICTWDSLKENLLWRFGELKISGHYEYSTKTCPNFDVSIL
jgi:N-acetylmuramoyl-L-alanine amidase